MMTDTKNKMDQDPLVLPPPTRGMRRFSVTIFSIIGICLAGFLLWNPFSIPFLPALFGPAGQQNGPLPINGLPEESLAAGTGGPKGAGRKGMEKGFQRRKPARRFNRPVSGDSKASRIECSTRFKKRLYV